MARLAADLSNGIIQQTPSIGAMRIACLGGAHLDTKARLKGEPRLGSSNPAHLTRDPGGVACNVARNLARMGVEVVLCSVVGDDEAAALLRSSLAAEGIDQTGLSVDPDHSTAGYLAVLDPEGSLVIGVADMDIYDTVNAGWVDTAVARASGADLWVVDANLPAPILEALAHLAPVPVFADPVSVPKAVRLRPILDRLDGVFPDAAEAAVLSGGDPDDPAANAAAIAAAGVEHLVVSLGAGGALLHTSDAIETLPAITPDRVADVTGAGDALLAGYACAVVSGEADPLGWGLAAASLAVETDTSVAGHMSREAIKARLQ